MEVERYSSHNNKEVKIRKRLIVEIEFIEEEETRTKPLVTQNLVVFPLKGGYEFYYSDDEQQLDKLSLKKVRVIEVSVIDSNVELLLENKLSEKGKKLFRHRN